MRVTIKDTMPGHIGSVTHDANVEPIILHLSAKDKENIAAMPADAHTMLVYPESMSQQQAMDHLLEGTPR